MAGQKTDFTDIKCCKCGKGDLTSKTAIRGECLSEDLRWKWVCQSCYKKHYDKAPDSHNNLMKAMRKSRNKELSKDCTSGKGFIGEQIWCKARGVENCNIKKDNFTYKYDHSPDLEYGIVNTKIATIEMGAWHFTPKGKYAHAVLFCMDKEWENVDRTYIIPEFEMKMRTSITITKNPIRGSQWYDKYRVDEKPYNNAYHNMNIEDCPILKNDEV